MGILSWGKPDRRQEPDRPQPPPGTIERLCREIGWVIVSQEPDRYEVRSRRQYSWVIVIIRYNERWPNATFQAWFPVQFSLETPPSGLFARVLMRSISLHFASWQMTIGENCDALLCVSTSLPTSSLNASLFRKVCEEIAEEIQSFKQELADRFAYGMGTVANAPPSTGRRGGAVVRHAGNVPGVWHPK